MNVNLAFTPQSHWAHAGGAGVANGPFQNIILPVPEKMYARKLYAGWRTDTGLNYTVAGEIVFALRGRTMASIPWKRTGTGGGGEIFFQVGIAAGVDTITFEANAVSQIFFPHNFIVACDTISALFSVSTTSGGAVPISFMGCLSSNLW